MKDMIIRAFKQLLAFFPTSLPTGVTAFHQWAESFFDIYGPNMPTSNVDSVKFVLADAIRHQGTGTDKLPKRFFYKFLRSAAAKQVAGQVFLDIKEAQIAAQKLAQENAQKTGS